MDNFSFSMFQPDRNRLAQVLRAGLMSNFKEVTVEWDFCPDLTQPPFQFSAPGLCGNTAILQVGGTGNMFPHLQEEKSYKIENLIQLMQRHTSFLIGGCIYLQSSNNSIVEGELSTDMLFSKITDNTTRICYLCCLTYLDEETGEFKLKQLKLEEVKCSMLGNFFVSEGKRDLVLKVEAKKRIGKLDFVEAMQTALSQEFPGHILGKAVGLGGIFIVKNTKVIHHIISKKLNCPIPTPNNTHVWLHYFEINAPFVAAGMFLNTKKQKLELLADGSTREVLLTTKQFHTFHDEKSGYYHRDIASSDGAEYLGYFSLAEEMILIDTNVNPSVPELSVVTSCW